MYHIEENNLGKKTAHPHFEHAGLIGWQIQNLYL
jgi:hypothetical protein